MTLIKFDPYRGVESAFRRMNRFVNEFDKGISIETGGFNPRVDIYEDDNSLLVHAEMPGIEKQDVKVSVNEDRILTIKGEKKKENYEENRSMIRSERIFGSFTRSFVLPENVDIEKVEASYNQGILELKLAKKEPEKPKEVEINIA